MGMSDQVRRLLMLFCLGLFCLGFGLGRLLRGYAWGHEPTPAAPAENLTPEVRQNRPACNLNSEGEYRRGLNSEGEYRRGDDFAQLTCEQYWLALWWTGQPTVAYICWALDKCSGREFPPLPPRGAPSSVPAEPLAPSATPPGGE
jgi:hypothetical protein